MENEILNNVENVMSESTGESNGFIGKAVIFGAGAATYAVGQIVVRKVKSLVTNRKAETDISEEDSCDPSCALHAVENDDEE